jgi:hypothetical protein
MLALMYFLQIRPISYFPPLPINSFNYESINDLGQRAYDPVISPKALTLKIVRGPSLKHMHVEGIFNNYYPLYKI